MPFLILLLVVLWSVFLIGVSAFCFVTGVPAAIADPTNFWAWVNIVVGFLLIRSSSVSFGK